MLVSPVKWSFPMKINYQETINIIPLFQFQEKIKNQKKVSDQVVAQSHKL